MNLVSRDAFEHTSVGFGFGGSPGHGAPELPRALDRERRISTDNIKATFAADVGRQNGPFDNPESWDKYKLFNKVTLRVSPAPSLYARRR